MSPDLATISRRRHLATIILRAAVLAWSVYVLLVTLDVLVSHLDAFLSGGVGGLVFELLLPLAVRLGVGACVLFMERRLVRWLVPLETGENACPRCGYALKNLKSPVCPECGLDLREPSAGSR